MKFFLIIMIACLTACVAACSSAEQPAQKVKPAPDAGRWQVYEMDGAAPLSDVVAWVEIDPASGKLMASAGCNELRAGFSGSLDAMKVGPIAATKKGCPDDLMAQERRLTELLSAATSIKVDDDGVLWLSGSRGMLRARLDDSEPR